MGVNNLLIVWLGIAIHYKLHVNVTRPNCQTGSANRIANQGRSRRVRAQVEGLVLQKDAAITHQTATVGPFATEMCKRLAQHCNLLVSFNQSCGMRYLRLL